MSWGTLDTVPSGAHQSGMMKTQEDKAAEAMERFEVVEMAGPAGLEEWLRANHARGSGVLAVTGKKGHDAYVSREALLDAVTAWGWIDGRRWVHPTDPKLTMQLVAPRDPAKPWSESYKARAAELERDGRMEGPGRAAVDAGRAAGGWDGHAAADALTVPDDLDARLGAKRQRWDALPPSYRRNVLRWVHAAKTDATRQKRLAVVEGSVASGARIPHM